MRGFDSCYSCFMKIQSLTSIRQYKHIQKKTELKLRNGSLKARFNLGKKNYRPIFIKKVNLLPNLSNKLYIHNSLPYSAQYEYYNHLQQVYLQEVNTIKPFRYSTPTVVNFYDNSIFNNQVVSTLPNSVYSVKSVTLNLTNFDMYYVNSLIDYYLSLYVLSKYRIHSKKASIIIAQIIDSGHFSRRTVYLSNTQSTSLKYKAKLTNYFNLSVPALYNINPLVILSRSPLTLDFDFYSTSLLNKPNTLTDQKNIINFVALESLLKNLLNLTWLRSKTVKSPKHLLFFRKYFSLKNWRFKKVSILNKYRNIFFNLRKLYRSRSQDCTNFLWQKKKHTWSSKRKLEIQFFNSFLKLPLRYKKAYNTLKTTLPLDNKKLSTFIPFNYQTLNLTHPKGHKINTKFDFTSSFPTITSPQLTLLYILQPWLLNTLQNPFMFKNNAHYLLSKYNIPINLTYTNLQPHNCFRYITSKKILSLFSTNKIREDVIPLYYNTLIRFMEHCSGKKIFIQLYPFLNQNVTYDYIVRYKAWITRMKSYERRLGHKFFFEEALHIMHLSFTLRDSVLFSSWLKAMILRISFWKTRTIFRFLRYLFLIYFVHIFPELKIKGLKIRLKGKISAAGNSRKRTILYRVGQTSHSELNLRVSHSKNTINTFTGVMGFQVWLFY